MEYSFRKYKSTDGIKVIDIFNHFIKNDFSAFPEKQLGYDFIMKIENLTKGYPYYVIETEENEIIGFTFLAAFHHADTFKHTAEVTYFILPGHTGKGLGSESMNRLTADAMKMGINKFVAKISSMNMQSLNFHIKSGFREVGRLKSIGRKFNTDFDVVWMQRDL